MGKMRDDGWLRNRLEEASADYEAQLKAEESARLRAKRIDQAVRVILPLIIFGMIATAYKFRKDLVPMLSSFFHSDSPAAAASPQPPSTKLQQTYQAIDEVSKESAYRKGLLEQIQTK